MTDGVTLNEVDPNFVTVAYSASDNAVTITAKKVGTTDFRLKKINPAGTGYLEVEVVIDAAGD